MHPLRQLHLCRSQRTQDAYPAPQHITCTVLLRMRFDCKGPVATIRWWASHRSAQASTPLLPWDQRISGIPATFPEPPYRLQAHWTQDCPSQGFQSIITRLGRAQGITGQGDPAALMPGPMTKRQHTTIKHRPAACGKCSNA